MKIIAFSDVHGDIHSLQKLEAIILAADKAIFLGDGVNSLEILDDQITGKLIAVKGNCDLFCPLPIEQVLEFNGKNILITHGHAYSVKSDLKKIAARVKELGADLALFGHTHVFQHMDKLVNVPSLKIGEYVVITLGDEIKVELKRI